MDNNNTWAVSEDHMVCCYTVDFAFVATYATVCIYEGGSLEQQVEQHISIDSRQRISNGQYRKPAKLR